MTLSTQQLCQCFQEYYSYHHDLGLALDLSGMNFPQGFFESMEDRMRRGLVAIAELEKGAIASPDENRMVSRIGCAIAPSRPTLASGKK